jgi:hypothetical protein
MAENPASRASTLSATKARLRDIAGLLREAGSLDPAARRALAELVDELTKSLESENLPAAELTHLAETTAQLGEALHQKEDLGVIGKAREGLQRAVSKAEANAPLAVGLARKLLDALSQIGI